MACLLLNHNHLGYHTLNQLYDRWSGLDVDLTLQMPDNMADTFLCLTDQQLSRINQLGSTCRDQSSVSEHGQNLFPLPLLPELLLLFDLVLLLDSQLPLFATGPVERWAEKDQVQVVGLGQVEEQWDGALDESVIRCCRVRRRVPDNGLCLRSIVSRRQMQE